MNMKENKEEYLEKSGDREGQEEMLYLYYNIKN